MDSKLLLYILLYLNIISFILGYLYSSTRNNMSVNINSIKNKSKPAKINNTQSNINIEEDKYVVAIDTSNIEKKYDSLGDIKQTTENITESIDKLKKLKR